MAGRYNCSETKKAFRLITRVDRVGRMQRPTGSGDFSTGLIRCGAQYDDQERRDDREREGGMGMGWIVGWVRGCVS